MCVVPALLQQRRHDSGDVLARPIWCGRLMVTTYLMMVKRRMMTMMTMIMIYYDHDDGDDAGDHQIIRSSDHPPPSSSSSSPPHCSRLKCGVCSVMVYSQHIIMKVPCPWVPWSAFLPDDSRCSTGYISAGRKEKSCSFKSLRQTQDVSGEALSIGGVCRCVCKVFQNTRDHRYFTHAN